MSLPDDIKTLAPHVLTHRLMRYRLRLKTYTVVDPASWLLISSSRFQLKINAKPDSFSCPHYFFFLKLKKPHWLHCQPEINVVFGGGFHDVVAEPIFQSGDISPTFPFTRAFPGEKVIYALKSRKSKTPTVTWLRVQDAWNWTIGPEDEEVLAPSHVPDRGFLTNVFSLRWFEKGGTRVVYYCCSRKRGIYAIGPARLDSGDFLWHFEQEFGPKSNADCVFQLFCHFLKWDPSRRPIW